MALVLAATIGVKALYLLLAWLIGAATSAYLSERKGYGERPGLASGLLLNVIGIVIWLVLPAREDSLWKKVGPFGTGGDKGRREAIAEESGRRGPDAAETG